MSTTINGFFDVTKDPVSWLIGQLSGQLKLSDNTTTISVTGRWTQSLNDVPKVVVYQKSSNAEWLSLGAERRRWNTVLGVRSWVKNQSDKFASYADLEQRMSDISKSYSASGYVFSYINVKRSLDEVDQVVPIYSTEADVVVIYDETFVYP